MKMSHRPHISSFAAAPIKIDGRMAWQIGSPPLIGMCAMTQRQQSGDSRLMMMSFSRRHRGLAVAVWLSGTNVATLCPLRHL